MPCHRSHHLMPWLCESSSSTHPEVNWTGSSGPSHALLGTFLHPSYSSSVEFDGRRGKGTLRDTVVSLDSE